MTHASHTRLSRRRLLQIGGAGLSASVLGTAAVGRVLSSPGHALASQTQYPNPKQAGSIIRRALAGTDGWISVPGALIVDADGTPTRFPAGDFQIDTNVEAGFPDGHWLKLDPTNSLSSFFPDDMSGGLADGQNLYIYGFRDVTGPQERIRLASEALNQAEPGSAEAIAAQAEIDAAHQEIFALKGHTQNSSPILYFDEGDQVEITLYNLGWAQRVDIPDGHTIHWHGFKNATPWFDGVPEMSGAAPIDKTFTYFYDCQEPGTYMYHCHWEDVEHIQMGMTGSVFIRPRWNKVRTLTGTLSFNGASVTGAGTDLTYQVRPGDKVHLDGEEAHAQEVDTVVGQTLTLKAAYGGTQNTAGPAIVRTGSAGDRKFVYNDWATEYDREVTMMAMDYDMRQHTKLSHIQQPDWTEYVPNAWLLNGRSYPDTVEANGTIGDDGVGFDVPGRPDLSYQPISSLVPANEGDRVLIRLASLGYQQHSMTLAGIPMKIIGRDANALGNATYVTDTVDVAPGESYDILFTAPKATGRRVAKADLSGAVDAVTVTSGGAGYSVHPTVDFSGGGGTAAAATAFMAVDAVTVGDPQRGDNYTRVPTVGFTRFGAETSGSGAAATAVMEVGSIPVTNGGTGFTSPPSVAVNGGGGSGATAVADMGVGTVTPGAFGNNYTLSPTVGFTGGGGGSGAAASAYLRVNSITLTNLGSGYTGTPTVTLSAPQLAGGVRATAVVSAIEQGNIEVITVTNPGSGYTAPPTVTISAPGGGGGTRAQARAVMGVGSYVVTNPGAGYTTPPAVTLTRAAGDTTGTGATATARLKVITVTAVNHGSGYTSRPTIAFTGGGGSGAAAGPAFLRLHAVNVTAGGSGYLSPPTVTFTRTAPDTTGTGAAATATTRVDVVTVTAGGSGYTTAPGVSFTGANTSPASATATLTITFIHLIDAGLGYTFVPGVELVGGGGSGAAVTVDGIDATGAVTGLTLVPPGGPSGHGYTSMPKVLVELPKGDAYMFYDRNFDNSGSGTTANLVGMATEVRVYHKGSFAPQTEPNTWTRA